MGLDPGSVGAAMLTTKPHRHRLLPKMMVFLENSAQKKCLHGHGFLPIARPIFVLKIHTRAGSKPKMMVFETYFAKFSFQARTRRYKQPK